MTEEITASPPAWEEWVSHPNRRRFVPTGDHPMMAGQQGWWALPGTYTEGRVLEMGFKPEKPR
jgi:hypothetical protein